MLKIAAAVGLAGLAVLAMAVAAIAEFYRNGLIEDALMDPDEGPTHIHPGHFLSDTHSATAGVESATRRERNAAGSAPRLAQTSRPVGPVPSGYLAGRGT